MSQVVADISVSLDGYATGPNTGLANGLGDRGEALHLWAFEGNDADRPGPGCCGPVRRAVLDTTFTATGAVVQGQNLFDITDAVSTAAAQHLTYRVVR